MSPTVFRHKSYRFFFFSREETRVHVHVTCPDGVAKFWIEPEIELAHHKSLSAVQLAELERIVESRKDAIKKAWKKHFKS